MKCIALRRIIFIRNVEQGRYYFGRIDHLAPTSCHFLSVATEYVEGVEHPIYYLNRSIQGAFPSEALSSSPRGACSSSKHLVIQKLHHHFIIIDELYSRGCGGVLGRALYMAKVKERLQSQVYYYPSIMAAFLSFDLI